MSSKRSNPVRRTAWTCLLAALTIALALALIATCRGQVLSSPCANGQCPPPAGWQSSPAAAQRWREVQLGATTAAAVCRVTNQHGGAASLGSGALVHVGGAEGYVLTCFHLFRDGVGQVSVTFAGQRAAPARVVAQDAAHDLALLAVARPTASPLPLATDATGAFAIAAGFGGDNSLRAVRGEVAGRSTPQGASYPSLLVHGPVRSGDSGGPLLTDRGELIGVVWGVSGQVTYATVGEPVQRVLDRVPSEQPPAAPPVTAPLAGAPIASNNPPAEAPGGDCQCECGGQCVRRGELDAYATLDDLRTATDGLDDWRPLEGADDENGASRGLTKLLPLLLPALGVGGPVGVALFAAQLLLRRRVAHRRGPGGPRDEGFRVDQPINPPPLRVAPARRPTRGD